MIPSTGEKGTWTGGMDTSEGSTLPTTHSISTAAVTHGPLSEPSPLPSPQTAGFTKISANHFSLEKGFKTCHILSRFQGDLGFYSHKRDRNGAQKHVNSCASGGECDTSSQ